MIAWRLKRVYAPPEPGDGLRVLVDRLWPRGLTRPKAQLDLWLKDLAPSDYWRKRLHADPSQWEAFQAGYAQELQAEPAAAALAQLRSAAIEAKIVSLLFAAREETHNNAVVLRDWLMRRG